MVVKSKMVSEHVRDLGNIFEILGNIFEILRKHKLRLNASKCSFGLGLNKFLSYMVTYRGIDVNPDQVKGFEWIEERALAFQQLKEYLSWSLVMSRPEKDEVLFSYIAVASHAVSLVLVRVDNGVQRPVYYSADYTRRIAKWGTILGAFDINYMPRTSVKGQVLADLVVEFAEPSVKEEDDKLNFSTINNEAEYKALLAGMAVVQKVEGELEAKDPRMQEYLNQVRHLQLKFKSFTLVQVPRSRNTYADSLATLRTSLAQSLPRVILAKDLCKPTKMKGDMVQIHQTKAGPSWMDSIVLFLKEDILPEEKFEADKVHRKAPRFWLFEDQKLYKCSFSKPYLLCIHPEVTELLLEELHEGICESHTGDRFLSHKALTQGYWWPNMQREVQKYVKKCDQC
ncbi:uncharacterized protein LOC142612092 [Castanea sativa]|uniref:uncharacterized protein LOC142612092 n=1 Tax=Castanea sativa TaxID=21020 RepID=UPI003F653095